MSKSCWVKVLFTLNTIQYRHNEYDDLQMKESTSYFDVNDRILLALN